MSFTVNLRIEITKADSRATRVWLFYKRLVLHLVKGLMKEMQNNTTKPNNRRAQTNVFSARDGESSGFCTWSRVYALSSQAFGKQTVNRQGQPALGRSVCCAHCTGCFVSRLVSCCSSGSPKGPRQPVELSEPRGADEFLVRLGVSPSLLHLTGMFGGDVPNARLSRLLDPEPDCGQGLWACSC